MRESLLTELACPDCHGDFALADARIAAGQIAAGALACRGCGRRFPIEHGVPNFVSSATGSRRSIRRAFADNSCSSLAVAWGAGCGSPLATGRAR